MRVAENVICHYIVIAILKDHTLNILCRYSSTLRVDAGYQWHADDLYFKILDSIAVMAEASCYLHMMHLGSKKVLMIRPDYLPRQ